LICQQSIQPSHHSTLTRPQTVGDIKAAVARKAAVPADKLQLFWTGRELTPAYDPKTLLEMNLHTGFSLHGYDLSDVVAHPPDYWPPVRETPAGLEVVPAN
jgi:hypothetical protein